MKFDRRAQWHLAQDSLDLLASQNDLPWSRRSCSDGGATGAVGTLLLLVVDAIEGEVDDVVCCGHVHILEANCWFRCNPRSSDTRICKLVPSSGRLNVSI